ncbi:MAG: ABC transporter substrate-binding protein [bacterium]
MTRLIAVLLVAAAWGAAQDAPQPYKDGRKTPVEFAGPGAESPEPEVSEVLFGWFGPPEGPMWDAANQALAELNRDGGYKGRPFRLLPGWADDPWRAGAQHLTRMAFRDRVWAIIATENGDAVHLAEQIAAKALLTVVNPSSSDRSIHTAGLPWIFSCVQGDDVIAQALAQAVKGQSVLVIASTDHDSRALLSKLKPLVSISRLVEFGPNDAGRAAAAVANGIEPAIVIADARDSAAAVSALRESGYKGQIYGGPSMGRAEFNGAGVQFPLLSEQTRFPDYASACAYDSVKMLAQAVRRGGLNRERIRRAMGALSPYEGASGLIEWDEFGQNRRPVRIVSKAEAQQNPQ